MRHKICITHSSNRLKMGERIKAGDKCNVSPEWLKSMAKRENLLHNEIPHYPIFVEHIRDYVSQPDYENKFLKTIQTVGEIISDSERWGKILTLTAGKNDEFPVNFDNLKIDDLYIQESPKIHCSVWEKYQSFKVFGTLEKREGRIVLEVKHFKPIQDIEDTVDVMAFLAHIAQCTYNQFGIEMDKKEHLRDYWNTAKLRGKRIGQKKRR